MVAKFLEKLLLSIDISKSFLGVIVEGIKTKNGDNGIQRQRVFDSLRQIAIFFNNSKLGRLENQVETTDKERVTVAFLGTEFTKSIGHILSGITCRLMAKELGLDSRHYVIIGNRHANSHLFHKYLKPKLPWLNLSDSSTDLFELANQSSMEKVGNVRIADRNLSLFNATANLNWEWYKIKARDNVLNLHEEDLVIGERYLESKGLTEGDWFVVLHPRWTGQGLADSRNVKIDSYRETVKWIIERGGYVFKIGLPDGESMNFSHEKYVDYSNSVDRTEQLDIFLTAQARLFIASSSGLSHLAMALGTPVLHTNITNMGVYPFYPKSRFIPKIKTNKAIANSNFLNDLNNQLYDVDNTSSNSLSVFIRDNTSQEILEATKEMFAFIESNFAEQDVLIQDLASLVSKRNNYPTSLMSSSFLANHASYFDF